MPASSTPAPSPLHYSGCQSGKSWRAPKLKLLIFIREVFGNSQMFPDVKRDREAASPECRYWVGTGKRMFPNARDGKFHRFFSEKSGSGEMAFGNADLYYLCRFIRSHNKIHFWEKFKRLRWRWREDMFTTGLHIFLIPNWKIVDHFLKTSFEAFTLDYRELNRFQHRPPLDKVIL